MLAHLKMITYWLERYMTEGLDKLPLKIGVILNSPVPVHLMNKSYITLSVRQPLTYRTASFLRTGAKSRAGYRKLKSQIIDFRKKKKDVWKK